MKPSKALALTLAGFLAAATLSAVGIQENLGRFGLRQVEESVAGSFAAQQTLSVSTKAAAIRIFRDGAPRSVSAALTGYASAPIKLKLNEGPQKTSIETEWKRSPGTYTEDLQLDIHISEDFSGSLELSSASGSITIPEGVWSALFANSASGSISIDAPTAQQLRTSSASGAVTIQRAKASSIEVKTVSGRVEVNTEGSSELSVSSVSGAVRLSGACSRLTVLSASGAVSIQPESSFEDLSVSTISGMIRIDLPRRVETYGQISSVSGKLTLNIDGIQQQRKRQSITWNAGESLQRIEAESISGSIRISE